MRQSIAINTTLTIRPWEERLSREHLCHDAADGPDVDGQGVVHPVQHDLRRAVPPRRHVASHLVLGRAREAKVEDAQLAVLVHRDVGGLQILHEESVALNDIIDPFMRFGPKSRPRSNNCLQ